MAHIGKEASAHFHRAKVAGIGLPVNLIVQKAVFQHIHIKGSIVRHQHSVGKKRLNLLP